MNIGMTNLSVPAKYECIQKTWIKTAIQEKHAAKRRLSKVYLKLENWTLKTIMQFSQRAKLQFGDL